MAMFAYFSLMRYLSVLPILTSQVWPWSVTFGGSGGIHYSHSATGPTSGCSCRSAWPCGTDWYYSL